MKKPQALGLRSLGGAAVILGVCASCQPLLGGARAEAPPRAPSFRLLRYERPAPPGGGVEASVRSTRVDLPSGATVSVQATDACAQVSGGPGQQRCELAVDALGQALAAAGYTVVHAAALASARQVDAARAAVESAAHKALAERQEGSSKDGPAPSEANAASKPQPALGVERVLFVDLATLAESNPSAAPVLQLFESDATGKVGSPAPSDPLRGKLEALAMKHPPEPPRSAVARLHVSLVTLGTGDVSLHYEGEAHGDARKSTRQFLFRIHGDKVTAVSPTPVPQATPPASPSQPDAQVLFERMGRDMVERLGASAKVGI